MTHIRVDDEKLNKNARFACGIAWPLPDGDLYWFEGEHQADRADCPGCNPGGPRKLGTPLKDLAGRPQDNPVGYAEFVRIAKSWGYD